MESLGRRNGAFGPIAEMAIPMNDRVCWLGDGVFDAGPARNYRFSRSMTTSIASTAARALRASRFPCRSTGSFCRASRASI